MGADHLYIKQWLAAERVVMSTCDWQKRPKPGADAAVLPAPLAVTDKSIAALQAQDCAYQNAALLFYANKLPEALAAYRAIAADKASIDRPQAAYMVVAIQAGSMPAPYGKWQPLVAPAETLRQIQAILADPSLKDAHAMTAGLIGWLGYNAGDEAARQAQVRETIAALTLSTARLKSDPEARKRYDAAKEDIEFLHSVFQDPDWILNGAVPTGYYASATLARLAQTNPMAAWVAFPRDPNAGNWAIVSQQRQPSIVTAYLSRMGANSGDFANPWVHINPGTGIEKLAPMVDREMARLRAGPNAQAAAALSFDFYNLERQLLMRGEKEGFIQAVQRLKDYPAPETELYRRTVHDGLIYLIAVGRSDEARQFRDALLLDAPVARNGYSDNVGMLMVLAEDQAHLVRAIDIQRVYPHGYVNALSMAALWRLADDSNLDRGNRALFARAAWTREYALSRTIDWRHDQLMRLLNPEVTAGWRSHVGRDVKPDDTLVLADVLKSPAMNMVIAEFSRMPAGKQPDESYGATSGLTGLDHHNLNDNNWWCGWEPDPYAQDAVDALGSDFGDRGTTSADYGFVPLRKLLGPALRQSFLFRNMDSVEHQALAGVTCAPKFLADRTIAWVQNNGPLSSRDGQAEALADVVVTTRWGGNRQSKHGEYSRHAYELLHTLFADGPAAKRTRYWFN